MRRLVALLTLAALSWSHLVAFRCDMGAATDPAAHHESGFASAHHAAGAHDAASAARSSATHAGPSAGESPGPGPSSPSGPSGHDPSSHGGSGPSSPSAPGHGAPGPSSPSAPGHGAHGPSSHGPSGHGDHGDAAGCVMALSCGAASAFAAQAAGITRLPALFVLPDFRTAPLPLAAAPAVETPPPRRTV